MHFSPVGSLTGFSLAGIPSDHFQKFFSCSAYDRPYGLLPGGKIFTEFESATVDNVGDNSRNIDKKDVTTKKKKVIRFTLSSSSSYSNSLIQKDYVWLYLLYTIIKLAD